MIAVMADTDILSTFGKVDRVDLFHHLFQSVHIAPAVYRELFPAERMGFAWVERVIQTVGILPLMPDESHATVQDASLHFKSVISAPSVPEKISAIT